MQEVQFLLGVCHMYFIEILETGRTALKVGVCYLLIFQHKITYHKVITLSLDKGGNLVT